MGIVTRRRDVAAVRESGRIVRKVLSELAQFVRPGVTTAEIDALGREILRSEGAVPSFLNYNGYPAAVCVSINHEVVHGIPSAERVVKDGDIVSIDVGAYKNGFHGDAADTILIGSVPQSAKDLVDSVYSALEAGISAAVSGNCVGDIGYAIQSIVEARGFGIVYQLVGHGIGTKLHEKPQIPNLGNAGMGMKLVDGMLLAIEPMVNEGTPEVRVMKDGWTIVTGDGLLSAHAENTVMVNGSNPELLTA